MLKVTSTLELAVRQSHVINTAQLNLRKKKFFSNMNYLGNLTSTAEPETQYQFQLRQQKPQLLDWASSVLFKIDKLWSCIHFPANIDEV